MRPPARRWASDIPLPPFRPPLPAVPFASGLPCGEPPVALVGMAERVGVLLLTAGTGRGLVGAGAMGSLDFATGAGMSGISGSGVISATSGISGGVGRVSCSAKGTSVSAASPVLPVSVSCEGGLSPTLKSSVSTMVSRSAKGSLDSLEFRISTVTGTTIATVPKPATLSQVASVAILMA